LTVANPANELGRITKPIAAAWKAKMLVIAASPLFNGNNDQATLENPDGTKLFNPDVNPDILKAKWDLAVVACKKAIELCTEADIVLYNYETRVALSDTIIRELTIRNTFTEKWNSEIIWANTQSVGSNRKIQILSSPNLAATQFPDSYVLISQLAPTIKIAEMYHTNHGLPMDEDKDWQSVNLSELRTGTDAERYYIRKGYTTIQMHFDREPRFYACLGFDGGVWFQNQGDNPDSYYYVACRVGGAQSKRGQGWGPFTGYFWKKSVYFTNRQTDNVSGYSYELYPWPIMRLADLYLLYAEAINESEGPTGANSSELFEYIDRVRTKAGLRGVKYSYDNYAASSVGKKYEKQTGMREIIHRERLIELSLEGQRFWDIRRWKEAPAEYRKGIEGYKLSESDPEKFYQRISLANQVFSQKDYFWPIWTSNIEQNPNLVQNTGW
jgi:hypothetical protein